MVSETCALANGVERQVPAGPGAGAALDRPRLLDRLLTTVDGRPARAVVVGPPGIGKTTLLAQAVARLTAAGEAVVWYTADESDRSADAVLDAIGAALSRVSGRPGGQVRGPAHLLDRLPAEPRPVTLVVDDAHRLTGAGAQSVVRLAELLPNRVRVVVAGRCEAPEWTRLHLAGPVVRLDATALRLRTSEVDRLCADHLRLPLAPEESAELARRTEGWVAGVRIFHLATVGHREVARRRVLAGTWHRLPLLRQYFTANVLDELPGDVQDFLVGSSVLPWLTASWCDTLLGRSDSALILDDLVDRNIFVTLADQRAGRYRCHPLFREYLTAELIRRLPPAERRARFRRAGQLIERGTVREAAVRDEALRAYMRAGEVWAAARLTPPPSPAGDADAWSALARARAWLCDGAVDEALTWYERAEAVHEWPVEREEVRRERDLVLAWVDPPPAEEPAHWSGHLRAALRAAPARVARAATRSAETATGSDRIGWRLTAALAELLAGDPVAAAERCREVTAGRSGPAAAVGAVLRLLLSDGPGSGPSVLADPVAADRDGLDAVPWLADALRILPAVGGAPDDVSRAERIGAERASRGDRWGALLAGSAVALGLWRGVTSQPEPDLVEAAHRALRRCADLAAALDAGTVEAWAYGGLALLARQSGAVDADALAARARALAALAQLPAVADRLDRPAEPGEPRPADIPAVIPLPVHRERPVRRPAAPPDPVPVDMRGPEATATVRCFGRFDLAASGQPVLWSTLRPRARSLLRLLIVRDGRRVHVENLYEQLWPDLTPDAARRNLHVAVSSVRRVLAPLAPDPTRSVLRRDADAYVLDLPASADHDLRRFTAGSARWRAVRSTAPPHQVTVLLREVLGAYTGDLIPEEGPAEWIIEERAYFRQAAVDAAVALATAELAIGQPGAAVETCRRGLRIDRLHDPIWRLLVEAYRRGGDLVAADRAAAGYRAVLDELGVAG